MEVGEDVGGVGGIGDLVGFFVGLVVGGRSTHAQMYCKDEEQAVFPLSIQPEPVVPVLPCLRFPVTALDQLSQCPAVYTAPALSVPVLHELTVAGRDCVTDRSILGSGALNIAAYPPEVSELQVVNDRVGTVGDAHVALTDDVGANPISVGMLMSVEVVNDTIIKNDPTGHVGGALA